MTSAQEHAALCNREIRKKWRESGSFGRRSSATKGLAGNSRAKRRIPGNTEGGAGGARPLLLVQDDQVVMQVVLQPTQVQYNQWIIGEAFGETPEGIERGGPAVHQVVVVAIISL